MSFPCAGKSTRFDVLLEAAQASGPELRLRASVKIDRYDFGITSLKGLAARRLDGRLDVVAHRL